MPDWMIEVERVEKRFRSVPALAGVDLVAERGKVLALLGPNGAGKTTMVRILATLLRPDAGRARVAGYDVVTAASKVRSAIGLAGQYAAVDEKLTGRENLEFIGLWNHLSKRAYREGAASALERFGLTAAGDRPVGTYSGGMRRRLDIAASIIAEPPVVFLDEPTTGLDPRTRSQVWTFVEERVVAGTTVLLTTQYMEEAERLAHRIVVIDAGKVIAEGTSAELKERVGGATIEARVSQRSDLERAASLMAQIGTGSPAIDADQQVIRVPAPKGTAGLLKVGRLLEEQQIALDDLGIRRPSLDEVFLSLTGPAAASAADSTASLPQEVAG